MLDPTLDYSAVLDNLRRTRPDLAGYTDKQVLEAWDRWSLSGDHPDESKIRHYTIKEEKPDA